jgi:hypothetical protein
VLRSSDQVRITAQLIEAATDKHLWSQSYEDELRGTLALQSKVARAIADQIRINLNSQEQAANIFTARQRQSLTASSTARNLAAPRCKDVARKYRST